MYLIGKQEMRNNKCYIVLQNDKKSNSKYMNYEVTFWGENIFCEVRADRKFISIILQWQCMLKIHKNKSKGITGKDMPFVMFFFLFFVLIYDLNQ